MFGSPPKPPTPTPAIQADATASPTSSSTNSLPPSLISTGAQGLKRKATTVKTSLIGGGQ